MRNIYCLILCGLVIGMWSVANGEKDVSKEKTDKSKSVPQLNSLSNGDRIKVLGQLSKDRSDLQTALISQLDESNPKEVNFAIAYLLGMYRMEQAVGSLSKYIALEAETGIEKHSALWDRYPVVEALIRIGNPAVPEMLKNIETSQDKKVRELSARVIRYVMGADIAKIVLQSAMQDKSDSVKVNFKAAIESLREQQTPEVKPDTLKHGVPATRPVSE